MSRLSQCFATLAGENKKALAAYVVSGDPSPEYSLDVMHQLVRSGANIIELGVPFSDPMAEGPVIQRGHERALEHKVSLKSTIDLVNNFRKVDAHTPVVLMGYANPIERMGYEVFAKHAKQAGVDAVLTVDLPPEEAVEQDVVFKAHGLDTIYLLAPTSTDKRVEQVSELASGFLYYVSLKGVTGAGHLDVGSVENKMQVIRKSCSLPVMIGFGIKDAASATAVSGFADGVIVGSALVDILGSAGSKPQALSELDKKVATIRTALDA